ncbi:hypothetical protein [Cyclobacterium xiamenense]|jgi:hypothetical protein|uniref:hypothetical protein n=1 Tax=Cyclobacterium xiamenense TaxID=1297121 RepID=UPI001F50687F|nr:hypothetical protein [Cyclobacterium xiamenense]
MTIRFLLICSLAWSLPLLEGKSQELLAGIHFDAGIPTGTFRSTSDIPLVPALGLRVLHGIRKTPIFIGADLGYGRYGTAVTKRRDLFPGVNQGFRIRRNNNYVNLMGVVRVMPDLNSRYRPFLEGQIGGIHTYTRSHVRENRLSEPISSGTEFHDWALMGQVGVGVMVAVNSSKDTFLELKVSRVDSEPMDFLTKKSASYTDQGELVLLPKRAGIALLQPSLGFRFLFN